MGDGRSMSVSFAGSPWAEPAKPPKGAPAVVVSAGRARGESGGARVAARKNTRKSGIRTVTGGVYAFWEKIPWKDLSEDEQNAFAHVGWCEESNPQNSYDLAEKYAVSWDELNSDVLVALASLGFDELEWEVVLSNCTDQCDDEAEESGEDQEDESGEVVDEDASASESEESVLAKNTSAAIVVKESGTALALAESTAKKVVAKAKVRVRRGGMRGIGRKVVQLAQAGVVSAFERMGMDSATAAGVGKWLSTDFGRAIIGGTMGVLLEAVPGEHPVADEIAIELQEEAVAGLMEGPLSLAFDPIKEMLVNVFKLTGDVQAANQVEAMSGMVDVLNPKAGK